MGRGRRPLTGPGSNPGLVIVFKAMAQRNIVNQGQNDPTPKLDLLELNVLIQKAKTQRELSNGRSNI